MSKCRAFNIAIAAFFFIGALSAIFKDEAMATTILSLIVAVNLYLGLINDI